MQDLAAKNDEIQDRRTKKAEKARTCGIRIPPSFESSEVVCS